MDRQYYFWIDGERKGPFLYRELTDYDINPKTWVWYEGCEDWVEAGMVEDLKPLFQTTTEDDDDDETEAFHNENSGFENRSKIMILAIILLVLLSGFLFYKNHSLSNRLGEMQKEVTQLRSDETVHQQREQALQAEVERQRKIAQNALKIARDKEKIRQNNLRGINDQLDDAQHKLESAKEEMENVRSFHFLRSEETKQRQIRDQQKVINYWQNKMDSLQVVKARMG